MGIEKGERRGRRGTEGKVKEEIVAERLNMEQ